MIFYHPDCDLHFNNYGIEIPIVDDRAIRVFNELKKSDPTLTFFPIENLPLITQIDLQRVHHKDYLVKIFGSESDLEKAMQICYELVDLDGNYNRYNPKNAKYSFTHARDILLKQIAMNYVAANSALNTGFSFFLGGGMHHAMSFAGRGFCLLNDTVVVLKKLQAEKKISHAWIIDIDAHKGDGTAELTFNNKSITTLSIHMKNGWPLNSGSSSDPWYIPSDLDIEVASGEEDQYLEKLKEGLNFLERNFPVPDLVMVINGADPYVLDVLPSADLLKLTKEQMLDRDKLVYNFFKRKNIPMSFVMAGGYGPSSWEIYYQFLHFVR